MTERPMNPTFEDNPDEPLPEEVCDFDSYEFVESRDIVYVPEPTEAQKADARKKAEVHRGWGYWRQVGKAKEKKKT